MSSSAVLGQFLWHELLTTDPEAGAGFYSKVLGWNKEPYESDAGYTMLSNAQGPVGGARAVGNDPLADTVGPNWLTYVGVPDLPAALAAVEARGGRVVHPEAAVPNGGGRYAVIADPQGGLIGVYEPGAGNSGASMAGPASWHELTAEDPEAGLEFYKAIFGWDLLDTHPMGGEVGNYYLFGSGTTQMGGIFRRPKHLPANWPQWLVYLSVPSVTDAAKAAQAAGGQVVNGPHPVPGGDWIVQLLDPHGVAVALHGPKEAAAPQGPSRKAKSKTKVKRAPAKAKPKVQPKSKVKAKAKAKTKTKTKAKTKTKTKTKAKAKAKSQSASRAKATAPRRAKTAMAGRSKLKVKARGKSAAKAKRKAARRGK